MDTIEFFKQKTNYRMFDEHCTCIYVYPYQYLQIRKNKEFYSRANYILLDGMMLTLLFNLFKISDNRRMSIDFSSIANDLLSYVSDNKKTLYLIGARDEEISQFIINIKNRYPDLNIIGSHHGYIKNNPVQYEEAIIDILGLNPDFLLCGMGSPLQEQFLFDVQDRGWNGTGFSCGGFIFQCSLKLDYYPVWVNKFKLRWLYRGIYEPKALLKTLRIPKFIVLLMYDILKHKLKKSPAID
jgi:exopolysaccharide biosynthesis WecB/TagA/CpsF family protein